MFHSHCSRAAATNVTITMKITPNTNIPSILSLPLVRVSVRPTSELTISWSASPARHSEKPNNTEVYARHRAPGQERRQTRTHAVRRDHGNYGRSDCA